MITVSAFITLRFGQYRERYSLDLNGETDHRVVSGMQEFMCCIRKALTGKRRVTVPLVPW